MSDPFTGPSHSIGASRGSTKRGSTWPTRAAPGSGGRNRRDEAGEGGPGGVATKPKRTRGNSGPGNGVVLQIRTCGKVNDERAMTMLTRIASLVKPLMKRHLWELPILREFYPDQKNLLGLNVNRGREIKLRLRSPDDVSQFFEEDFVMGTMLHELTHNIRGPHDDQFYRALDALTKEYEDILASGWRCEGFDAPGRRVGQGVSHDLPPHLARKRALETAEKRLQLSKIMGPPGGRKVGGGSLAASASAGGRRLTPGEMAALAAERRKRDSVWCGGHYGEGGQSGKTLSESESDCSSDEEGRGAVGSSRSHISKPEHGQSSADWICSTCTLINKGIATTCELCSAIRLDGLEEPVSERTVKRYRTGPSAAAEVIVVEDDEAENPAVDADGDNKKPIQWECARCTWPLNSGTAAKCEACLAPRSGFADTDTSPLFIGPQPKTMEEKLTEWHCSTCSLVSARTAATCDACDELSPFVKQTDDGLLFLDGMWQCPSCTKWTSVDFQMCLGCQFLRVR
ncbi:WLM domain-containing protein [Zopfochytrium polystomum]|nr:WLM domain-containing protein [Zopfochytrium polystomum]